MEADPSADGRPSVGADPGKARQAEEEEEAEEENSSSSEQQTQESEVRSISPAAVVWLAFKDGADRASAFSHTHNVA